MQNGKKKAKRKKSYWHDFYVENPKKETVTHTLIISTNTHIYKSCRI